MMRALLGLLVACAYAQVLPLVRPFITSMRYRVAPEAVGAAIKLDPQRPVCYVLPQRSWIDLF
ncbi:MAG: hypothetical protein JF591_20875, partial [Lysobacter sp.]|nr:hypothetical protein [Lysobacter sp.]